MELKEMRSKGVEDLTAMEEALRRELADLQLKRMGGQEVKSSDLRRLRRDRARVLTLRGEKQRALK